MNSPDDQSTGLPLPALRTWRGVYWLVSLVAAMYIVLLAALTRIYQ